MFELKCHYNRYSYGIDQPFPCAAEKGHLAPMHWLFFDDQVQTMSRRSISTPKCSRANSMAASMDRNESRLQQRGPPTLATDSSDVAVMWLESAKGSSVRGVDF